MDKVMTALMKEKQWQGPVTIEEAGTPVNREYRWSDLGNAERLVNEHGPLYYLWMYELLA